MGQTLSEPKVEKSSLYDKNQFLMYGLSAMQGWRLTMEDAHCAELKLQDTEASFFGVFDGHAGSTAAQLTGKYLQKLIRTSEYFDKKEYEKALVDAYMKMDRELLEDPVFLKEPSGCTAVTALFTPDHKSVFVANAGDSRCIISSNGESKALSYDHKPGNPKETQRIIDAGGFVEFGRVNGNLALSRAIGDFEFKQNDKLPPESQAVTCDPDIIQHSITEHDEFLVLACDGIWDCMTNQQVVNYIRQQLADKTKLDSICEDIMDYCLAPTSEGGGVGCDNMSVMIIAVLNGKSEEEWYDWMASHADGIPRNHTSLAIKRDEKPLPTVKEASHKDGNEDKPTVESPQQNV
ncbi:PP2C-domain-containing protein [Backusella circina FSU 941]|nr:PP2C-domain-containing protein [Backusella circina FSU 941]